MSAVVPQARKNGIVRDPRFWATSAGYEFRVNFGHADMIGTLSATNDGLSGYGWTWTFASLAEGTGGDFLNSSDVDATAFYANSGGIVYDIRSACIFGSYDHALMASRFLGYMPTRLCLEAYAQWTVTATNETSTNFGFGGGAQASASIVSNGTNFILRSTATSDTGAAVDTSWHVWRIEVGATDTEWFIDGASQGTYATLGDRWPNTFNINSNQNGLKVAWARVWYE